jgi:hypothetical protein
MRTEIKSNLQEILQGIKSIKQLLPYEDKALDNIDLTSKAANDKFINGTLICRMGSAD